MTHNTDKVGFPNIPLTAGTQIVLEARDPTTDAEVAGVSASKWLIFGSDMSPGDQEPALPLYSPSEIESEA